MCLFSYSDKESDDYLCYKSSMSSNSEFLRLLIGSIELPTIAESSISFSFFF